MLFSVVVLLCSSTLQPQACTRDTALDVIVQRVGSDMECVQTGQPIAAKVLSEYLSGSRYVVVRCERKAG